MNVNKQISNKLKHIVKVQSSWRRFNLKKQLTYLSDNYTYDVLCMCLDKYIADVQFNTKINSIISKKKRRNENFPSDISENISKFAIAQKYGIMPTWDTEKGDIVINKHGLFKQIEVKGFMSSGPSSFGPSETWDLLYFVDAREFMNKNFKVYEVKLTNKDQAFRNLKVSKKETYGDIANSGRRPRGCFDTIFKPQLGNKCELIFDGHLSELKNIF
jgi:hypothetical protein